MLSLQRKADKKKFDAVLGKLIKAEPQKRSEATLEKKPSHTFPQGIDHYGRSDRSPLVTDNRIN